MYSTLTYRSAQVFLLSRTRIGFLNRGDVTLSRFKYSTLTTTSSTPLLISESRSVTQFAASFNQERGLIDSLFSSVFSLKEVGVGEADWVDDVVVNDEPDHNRKHRPYERVVNFLRETAATLLLSRSRSSIIVFVVFPTCAATVVVAVLVDGTSENEGFIFGVRHFNHFESFLLYSCKHNFREAIFAFFKAFL